MLEFAVLLLLGLDEQAKLRGGFCLGFEFCLSASAPVALVTFLKFLHPQQSIRGAIEKTPVQREPAIHEITDLPFSMFAVAEFFGGIVRLAEIQPECDLSIGRRVPFQEPQ